MTAPNRPDECWRAAMRCGDFAAAWDIADAALRVPMRGGQLPPHQRSVWRGEPLAGRNVRVRCTRGLGDTIQHLRFLPALRAIARSVTLLAPPAILPLAQGWADQVLPMQGHKLQDRAEAELEIMELPHALRMTEVPWPGPYVRVKPRLRLRGGDRRLGVVWRSGGWDKRRDAPLRLLRPLQRLPGVRLHSLQLGTAFVGRSLARPAVLETAAGMAALDGVLAVDTFVAHLAGAMGLPTLLLLHTEADWRWGEGDTTPWYPSLRLFRQQRPGDWRAPIERVAEALRRTLKWDPEQEVVVGDEEADKLLKAVEYRAPWTIDD